jgi:hypothetical protein
MVGAAVPRLEFLHFGRRVGGDAPQEGNDLVRADVYPCGKGHRLPQILTR